MASDSFYTIGRSGHLELVHSSKLARMVANGEALTYEQLTLPQRVEAEALKKRNEALLKRLDQAYTLAKQLHEIK